MIPFHTPANFSSTTLSAAVAASDTLLNVNSVALLQGASVFPFFVVMHPSANDYSSYEILEVTGGSGTQIIAGRGKDNTTATAFANGAVIEQNPVAINTLELQALIQTLRTDLDAARDLLDDSNEAMMNFLHSEGHTEHDNIEDFIEEYGDED